MTARLPDPGQDAGVWGSILNSFLSVEHNADGTLKIRTDGTFYAKPSGGIPASDMTVAVQASLAAANTALQPGGVPGGDLTGTYNTPTVIGIKGIPITGTAGDGQVLAYSQGSNQWIPSTVGSGGTVGDATGSTKGIVRLNGDLGGGVAGTADSPQVTSVHLASPLAVGMGGTGAGSQQAALNALAGTQSAGKYLRSDGTNTTLSTIQAGDVPTLNQNTTGNAATATLASTVTTNANLTGPITSTGNATAVASQTGTGSTFVMSASPALTGTPTAPTAASNTNTTQLATTAFVTNAVTNGTQGFVDLTNNQTIGGIKTFSSTIGGDISGNAATATLASTVTTNANLTGDVTSVGNATTLVGTANVESIIGANSTVAAKAPLASPAFTGTPTAPTATAGTNTTQIATTAFVTAAIPAVGAAGAGANVALSSTDPSVTNSRTPTGSAGGDLLGSTYPNPVVAKIQGIAISGTPASGNTLVASSSSAAAWGTMSGGALATITNQQGQPLVLGASGAMSWGYPWQFNVLAYGAKGDGSTDDTSAIQTAINTAVTWAQTNGGYCEVIIPPTSAYYAINGALQQGGSTLGNAQIALPVIDTDTTTTNIKVTLILKGTEDATGQFHWKQTVPQRNGATLVSNGLFGTTGAQSTSITNNGHPVVIGGPTQKNGYGTALKFSNMLIVIKGLNIVTPLSTTGLNYGAMDFTGVAQAQILDSQWGQNTTYANTWTNAGNISTLNTGLSVGLVMPAAANNDNNLIRNCVVAGGFQRGVVFTEHTVIERMAVLYCYTSLSVVGASYLSNSPSGTLHAVMGDQISAEGYHTLLEVLGSGQGGVGPVMDFHIDTEGTPIFAGTGFSTALGTIYMAGAIPGSFTVPTTTLKIVQEYRSIGPVATPTFATGSPAAAVLNPYWHDAFVQIAGGSVTAIKIGATLGGASAPTMNDTNLTSGMFLVPAGGWIEIDCTVLPTVNNWVLI